MALRHVVSHNRPTLYRGGIYAPPARLRKNLSVHDLPQAMPLEEHNSTFVPLRLSTFSEMELDQLTIVYEKNAVDVD